MICQSLLRVRNLLSKVMTDREQVMAFAADLEALVYRYRDEFDITVASLVGVLECAKYEVLLSAGEGDDEFEIDFE